MRNNGEKAAPPPIDKTAWGEGPWQTEPDHLEFEHAGYPCQLLRHDHLGFWCGYVGVGLAHPLYRKTYGELEDMDIELDVHGGLTYSGDNRFAADRSAWWFGFDCGHAFDLCPGASRFPAFEGFLNEVYRDIRYVCVEVRRLAEQLRRLEGQGDPPKATILGNSAPPREIEGKA